LNPDAQAETGNEMGAHLPITPKNQRPKSTEVNVAKAKGRPMLTWVGKRPLGRVTAYPAQWVERYTVEGTDQAGLGPAQWSDWPAAYPTGGLLFHGDNKDVLAHLLANGFRGRVKLIYIDPPFDSGADYVRKVQLRGPAAGVEEPAARGAGHPAGLSGHRACRPRLDRAA
jgi:hypothetical protein